TKTGCKQLRSASSSASVRRQLFASWAIQANSLSDTNIEGHLSTGTGESLNAEVGNQESVVENLESNAEIYVSRPRKRIYASIMGLASAG
ncbi:MAG TPA: hypothetical protein VN150_00235, partial [Ochrobactrum sp.]|nr:hypothetical protein [Ochrobactrum sp.]